MVVLVDMGNTKIDMHHIQKRRLGQRNAFGSEIALYIKAQAVLPRPERCVVVQHAIGVATIRIEREALDHTHNLA